MSSPGSLSDFAEQKLLYKLVGATDFTAPSTLYVALFTTMPADDGSGAVECSGGSYARASIANNTTQFPQANPVVNANAIAFPTSTAGWGTVIGAGVYDASTGGNLLWYSYLVGAKKTISSTDTSTDTITSTAHGFTTGQAVVLWAVDGTLPGGLSEFTTYYVSSPTTNTYKLSATQGGAAIDITSTGSGAQYAALYYGGVVNQNTVFTIPAGSLSLSID